MIWPSVVVDNFFDDYHKIKSYGNTLKYKKDPRSLWPGERTDLLHTIDPDFFSWSTNKILSLIYPMKENIQWTARQYFQKIDGNKYKSHGWIHRDHENTELTAIIYLSEHKHCGTSLYKQKNFNKERWSDKKHEYYKTLDIKYDTYREMLSDDFNKSVVFESIPNRLVMFDGAQYHAADGFEDFSVKEPRMTLITFFESIHSLGLKYPLTESKRV